MAARDAVHPSFRGIFLRTRYKDLLDVRDKMGAIYPRLGARWMGEDKRWVFPNGGRLLLGYAKTMAEVEQYVGQEYTHIYWDELGLLPEEKPWDLLQSRLRSTDRSIPLRARASANPGGTGHAWLKRRFVDATNKGTTIVKRSDGTSVQFVPGRATDNPSLPSSYWDRLNRMPEPLRSWLRDGDWSAGLGLAFTVVQEKHLVRRFTVPSYWTQFGSFDWGFSHPFCAGWFAVSEDGDYFLVDTVWGRGKRASEIADSIKSTFPLDRFVSFYAGHDIAQRHHARSEGQTPTIQETLAEHGVSTSLANINRVFGANRLRDFLALDNLGHARLMLLDTPGNRLVLGQLESAVTDPDHPEDILKADADPHSDLGETGDDGIDMLRYGIASRMSAARTPPPPSRGVFDRGVLAVEARQQRLILPDEPPPKLYTGM